MGRMAVIFDKGKLHVIDVRTSLEYFCQCYTVVITINKPYNQHNVDMVYKYFEKHPEKIIQYFLK